MPEAFPWEKLVEFTNDPYYLGRITVHQVKERFHVEVDIVNKESFKIYRHIGSLYDFEDPRDALDMGYRELRKKVGLVP
jgi:glutathionyl-hydroquinone reductase